MAPSILVIDADRAGNKLVRIILEAEGWAVVVTESLAAARLALRELTPDVIAAELALPDGEALPLLAEVARAPATRHTAIVAVTALHNHKDAAMAAGCVGYRHKPIDIETFGPWLRSLVASRAQSASTVK